MTTLKACNWSITINNPTQSDLEEIRSLPNNKWFKGFENQMEKGKDGTEHIQGHLRTESIRFSAIKKALTRAHIEPAKNAIALANYVKKEDTRIGDGVAVQQCSVGLVYAEVCKFWDSLEDFQAEYEERIIQDDFDKWKLSILDRAVGKLIRNGMIGVEFFGANPQTRSAFKVYFMSIIHRQYNALKVQDPTQEEVCSQTPQINDLPSPPESPGGNE